VDLPPSLYQQAVISHFLRECMLKNVFQFREEAFFINELETLQI